MALLQDLIQQIDDAALRERILQETNKLVKQKKFGLVFEEHLPECTPLYDVPIRVGSKVALKTGYVSDIYTVVRIDGSDAVCDRRETHEEATFHLSDIVAIAEFGEPIYPTLKPLDAVENAPDSDLWHALIEADNYHALQLLEYLYAEKVDCIYIDPPYNTGAKDWKYNNDYVDSSDAYRHSKWLSMMEKRLKLAKKLLNPKTGVLIVTIDEHEVHHLRMLLEEVLPEAYIQMVTDVINPKGSTRGRFSRVEEYVIFCFMPDAFVVGGKDPLLGDVPDEDALYPRWKGLLNSGTESRRENRPDMFYPILVDEANGLIIRAEPAIPLGKEVDRTALVDGYKAAWPVRSDGSDGRWMLSPDTFNLMLSKGYVSLGRYDRRRKTWGFSYLSRKYQTQIENAELEIVGRSASGQTVVAKYASVQGRQIKTVWHRTSHDAGAYGSDLITKILGQSGTFSFPKSIYAEKDAIAAIVRNKPNALIVDFFAGSGTTLHAVNLLNAEDGGSRRCILVTNNEVSESEARSLTARGIKPSDDEWEKLGIARYVTWPRTVCSIKGKDANGNSLQGSYIGSDSPMADGFKANAAFFKLSFLDKTSVAMGRQFKNLLPVLWMKGGAVGRCPSLDTDDLPKMLVLPQNKMAVLVDETYYAEFDEELGRHPEIKTVYIVTDSEVAYRAMTRTYDGIDCYQLYRDYLDNFRINIGR